MVSTTSNPQAVPAAKIPQLPYWNLAYTIWRFVKEPIQIVGEIHATYGDLVKVPFPQAPMVLFFHPDAVADLLRTPVNQLNKSLNYRAFSPILGDGLVTSNGGFWRQQRKAIQPEFNRQRIAAYSKMIAKQGEEHWDRLHQQLGQQKQIHDLSEVFLEVTFAVMAEALFGTNLDHHTHTVAKSFPTAVDHLMNYAFLPLPRWMPLPSQGSYKKAIAALEEVVADIIKMRREELEAGSEPRSFIERLLTMEDQMDDKLIRDEVLTMLLAGHETTSNALTWTTWQLMQPSAKQSLRQLCSEVQEVCGSRSPQAEDYDKLIFTKQVFLEGMRLGPPAYMISRTPVEQVEVAGVEIDNRTIAGIPIYHIHRHPEFWPEPLRFDPQRFTAENQASRHPYAYLPFGAGPRRCIGSEFAMLEGVLLLAGFCQRFGFQAVAGYRPRLHAGITLRPGGGMPAWLSQRNKTS